MFFGERDWVEHSTPARTNARKADLQSIVGTTLFYGYGFGLYGHLGIGWIPVLAAGIFTLQMILSRYWLTRFRYGPAEWLWRYLTYRGKV